MVDVDADGEPPEPKVWRSIGEVIAELDRRVPRVASEMVRQCCW